MLGIGKVYVPIIRQVCFEIIIIYSGSCQWLVCSMHVASNLEQMSLGPSPKYFFSLLALAPLDTNRSRYFIPCDAACIHFHTRLPPGRGPIALMPELPSHAGPLRY